MNPKRFFLTWLAALVLISVVGAGVAIATPSSGVTTTTFAIGAFDEIDAKVVAPDFQVRIDTKGTSDVHVLENRLAPGATFGWHSHPGPSFVVVKTGALWVYKSDAPGCAPEIVRRATGSSTAAQTCTWCAMRARSKPLSTSSRSSRRVRPGGSTSRRQRAAPPDRAFGAGRRVRPARTCRMS